MITGGSDKSYIFINEDMTKSARSILWNTKKQLRQVFKYIWVSNGKILIKKADGEKTTCVRSLIFADLNNFDIISDDRIFAAEVNSLNGWLSSISNNKCDLCLLHVNIRSLKKYFSELLVTLHDSLKDIHIIVITEPNINSPMLNLYQIKGFHVNSFTRTNRTGGGVLVYTRDTWLARVSETPHTTGMRAAECVSIVLDKGTIFDEPIYLLSLYRPPRINKKNKVTQFLYELRNILESLPKKIKIVLCGDININLLDKSPHVTEYENLLAEFGLIKCIDKTTRQEILNGKIVRSCLDHIYIRAPSAVIQSAVIQHKIADHYYVSAAVQWERAPPCTVQRCSMPAASRRTRLTRVSPAHAVPATQRRVLDNRLVREKLLAADFNALMSYDCPLKLYNALRQLFINIYNDCYKTQITRISDRNKCWVTDKLKQMIAERDRLFTLWSYDPKNMVKRLAYTKYRNKCTKLINKCNNDFVKQSIVNCNNNIRKIWEKINLILGKEKKKLG
ncbi:unnamed protein product [Euphydryas editha]|uniref:Endonuclease/exonuclease/phosphatase domain-containing protein n=1 Tax=Euphydryas editha TaxID=104508 RepID=A0AAU9TPA1_EUPED|nr:unnamed protein product [Euphydryas editha]